MKLSSNIFVLLLLVAVAVQADDIGNLYEEGNQFYEAKQFDSAIVKYEQILNEGKESANLYFNLGNAYFKEGDLGHAILHYQRAKRLKPSDDDIINNLEFASQFTTVPMEGVELNPINSFMASLVASFNVNSLAWISSVLFVLFIVALIFRWGLHWSQAYWRYISRILLVFVLISATLTTFKYRNEYLTERAVIVAAESTVYTGPTVNSDVELEGAPGLVVEIVDESGEFYNILFENKRRGWIQKRLVEVI